MGAHTLNSCCLFFCRKNSLKVLVGDVMLVKEKVKEKLRLLGTPGSWDHITDQKGPNSYLGLNCKCLRGGSSPVSDLGIVLEH